MTWPGQVAPNKKFKDLEELRRGIEAYFESCFEVVEEVRGEGKDRVVTKKRVQARPFTMSGLAYFLGVDRQTLLRYRWNKTEAGKLIQNAKKRIELYVEEQLLTDKRQVAGVIFNLKNNFGWTDEKVNKNLNASFSLSDLLKAREQSGTRALPPGTSAGESLEESSFDPLSEVVEEPISNENV